MSEAKQVPGQALLELFDEAAKSYAHIVSLASLAPSWDGQRTIEELALAVLRAGEDVGGVLSDVENIIKFYITASTVAGKDYDARKVRLLLRSAKGLVRLAERIRVSAPRERNGYELTKEQIAKEFAKDLMSNGVSKPQRVVRSSGALPALTPYRAQGPEGGCQDLAGGPCASPWRPSAGPEH